MPASTLSAFCPRCGKNFNNPLQVTRHMNQKSSLCLKSIHDSITIDALMPRLAGQQRRDRPVVDYDYAPANFSHDEENRVEEDVEMEINDQQDYEANEDLPRLDDDAADADGLPDSDYYVYHDKSCKTYGLGDNLFNTFDGDEFAEQRKRNLYHPFLSRLEWGLGFWLLSSGLSMAAINSFLALELIRGLNLSFSSAKKLRSLVESLPSGPEWMFREVGTAHPTKSPVILYYRDALQTLQCILSSPLLKNSFEFTPYKLYTSARRAYRKYTQWMSAQYAWSVHSKLPEGATVLGVVLGSDKTVVSVMTGNRVAYPLVITLANILMEFRMKSNYNALQLLALLPVAKFIHPVTRIRSLLQDRLVHRCLDIVLEPLKIAAQIGTMLDDPMGYSRYCFTPLASYIVDTPEAQLLACVAGKTSPVTMAMYKDFGDPFRHTYRSGQTTIDQIEEVNALCDPEDVDAYQPLSLDTHRLSGVDKPFWRNWVGSNPCIFLTPEILHHLHKEFWDHDAKWCIKAVGPAEIDFRFNLLQILVGYRSFKDGISDLKQVTGRDHREIQRYIVAVIAGAVTRNFLIAIRALMDFRYLCQCTSFTDDLITKANDALNEFHIHKQAILDAKARTGKANKPINNFYIPKLELMQIIVPSISVSGVPIQWSADMTENSHKRFVKEPARAGNFHDQNGQICRTLDRQEKCATFNIITATRDIECIDMQNVGEDEMDMECEDDVEKLLEDASEVAFAEKRKREAKNYFVVAEFLVENACSRSPRPHRTFFKGGTAYHLLRDPHYTSTTIDAAATKFELPDLRPALVEYLRRYEAGTRTFNVGGRRIAAAGVELSNVRFHIWCRVRLQLHSLYSSVDVMPSQTLNAFPPSDKWKYGQCDTAVVNIDPNYSWPASGIEGHIVVQIRMILHVPGSRPPFDNQFLAYVQRFDFQQPNGQIYDEASGLIPLKRAFRSDETRVGDFVPLSQIRAPVHLVPQFGKHADPRLTKETALECWTHYWLNTFFDKYMFDVLRFD